MIGPAGEPAVAAAVPRSRRPRLGLSHWQRDKLSGLLFVMPQLVGFAVFVLGPILAVFWFSAHDWHLVRRNFDWVLLDNYAHMPDDRLMGRVALNSVIFSLGYVPLNVGLGLIMALALNRALRGISIFRTLFFMPVVVSLVAWTIIWRFMLNNDGVLNGLLENLGVNGPNWLRIDDLAMVSVILIQILKNAGLSMVLFLAALQGIPQDLVDAARVDGADGRRVLRHITLPLISPFIFLATVLAVITSLKSFSLIFLTTAGGPGDATTVLAYYIFRVAFEHFEMGYASALAVILFLCVLLLTIVQFMARKRWVAYET